MGDRVVAVVDYGKRLKSKQPKAWTRLQNKASIFRAQLRAILLALALIRRSKEKNFIIF